MGPGLFYEVYMGKARRLAVLAGPFLGWSLSVEAAIVYVDSTADGAGDGSTWADAFTNLSVALVHVESGDQVWVAKGSYRPGSGRADTFQLKDGVGVYGGFAGFEDPFSFTLNQRNIVVNETILEGEIGAPGPSDNVFHVVTASNVARSAVLDGFTVARGNGSGLSLMRQDVGGGMLILNASPVIGHCLFRDAQAGSRGGAVHIAGGSPYFAHCRFVGNRTTVTQGANNVGGAVYYTGTPAVAANPLFVNCLFVGNRAGVGNGGSGASLYGGGYGTASLVNCTLLHNRADTLTGGVFGSATITNSIFYGNQDRNGLEITAQLRGAVVVSHSLVQGGWSGAGNLNADPLFKNAIGPDGIAGTLDDDAHLLPGSPCIDAGSNFAWPAEISPVDLDGASRFMNDSASPDNGEPIGMAIIDMGSYEKQSFCTINADCNDGLYCNGGESCTEGRCQQGSAPDCDDHVPCTSDRCVEVSQACAHESNDALCNDGVFCNGMETCDALLDCVSGPPPECDDGVACTFDDCDEQADLCVHTSDASVCDDHVFCNGVELCDPILGCTAGPTPCADGIDCTVDACDELNQLCDHTPDSSACDDGIFCNGAEECTLAGCAGGIPPCPNGSLCDEVLDICTAPPTPCLNDDECDDGNACTDDRCVLGFCAAIFNTLPCDDANDCTENDTCDNGACAGSPVLDCGNPPPGPGSGGNPPVVIPPVPSEEDAPPSIDDVAGENSEPTNSPSDQPEDDSDAPADSPSPCTRGEPCDQDQDTPAPSGDSDGDGVTDDLDLCPSTPLGLVTDASGCAFNEPTPGRGTLVMEDGRRCGACGAMGTIGVVVMVCVPGTVLVTGRPRGRKTFNRNV